MQDVFALFPGAVVAVGAMFASWVGPPVSGALYAAVVWPMQWPLVGVGFRAVLNGPVKLAFPIKAVCWLFGSLAALAPVLLAVRLGVEARAIGWGAGFAGAVIVCNQMHRVLLFDVTGYRPVEMLPPWLRERLMNDAEAARRILRSNFVDMTILGIGKLISGFALILFALSAWFSADPISVAEALGEVVARLGLAGEAKLELPGWGNAVFSAGLALAGFVYLVFFVSLAAGMLELDKL